jgi:very-short-patch-repair endonuclease
MYGKFESAKLRARQLRKEETSEEKIFWELVRARRFQGKKFYRQFPIAYEYRNRTRFFICDFYCFEERLVVEIDGPIHNKQKAHDERRTAILNGMGLRVLRFLNEEFSNPDNIIMKLSDFLKGNLKN